MLKPIFQIREIWQVSSLSDIIRCVLFENFWLIKGRMLKAPPLISSSLHILVFFIFFYVGVPLWDSSFLAI